MVFKYSKGCLPDAALEKFDPDAADIIAAGTTGGYFQKPAVFTPLLEAENAAKWKKSVNVETWAWPVYYMLAGIWCRLGKSFAFTALGLLYWIRFLNALLIAVFVWISYVFSRRFFRSTFQLRVALPFIVAFFPQDVFYGITADVLSPVVFAAAFLMLLEICTEEKSRRYHLLAGLAAAVAFLTKASNIAIMFLAAGVVLIKIKQALSQKYQGRYLFSLVVFAAAAGVPVAMWLGRNYILFGDFSGAAASIEVRTWTPKPFSETLDHPIFTPSGMFYFITELTKTFWRGEFIWNSERIASGLMDWFYVISSVLFISASVLGLVLDSRNDSSYRLALSAGLFVIVLSAAFLAAMSMRYDFGRCFYPSRAKPYFVSGRLIAGAILPFLLLYIDGLYRILSKLRLASLFFIAVAVIAAAITISEIILSWEVFNGPYHWFRL